MPRIVRCGLIQAENPLGPEHSLAEIKKAMITKHVKLIEQQFQTCNRRGKKHRHLVGAVRLSSNLSASGTEQIGDG